MVLGSHLGVPCGLDLKSQSLVIESFSVGSRAVLSAWRSFRCFAASKKKSSTFRLLFFARFFGCLWNSQCLGGFAGHFEWGRSLSTICSVACVLSCATHTQHARNMACCVHVAYVLRMTKPTQRCEGCKILKCLWTLSHFPWSTLNRRQNAATAVFTLYSGAAPFSFCTDGSFPVTVSARSVSIRYPLPLVPTIFLISRSLGWAQEEKNDWDVLHIISVSSMFLGRIFLV